MARWLPFMSPILTDHPDLKWGNYYHYNYYCQVILDVKTVAALEREGSQDYKALNPPQPIPSRGQLQQAGKTDSAGIEIPGLDMTTPSRTKPLGGSCSCP